MKKKIIVLMTIINRKGAQPPPPPDKAQMAFKLYDKDKDGYITRAEMVKLSKTLTKEQVEKVGVSDRPHISLSAFCRHFPSLILMEMES